MSARLGRGGARLGSLAARAGSTSILGLDVPLISIWFVLATILAFVTERVADWNDMTDELVWERLSISVGQTHSVLPRLHEQLIPSLSQLYPLLVAPFFWSGHVPSDIRDVHIFNAWLMSSAAIPAFLLARRVTGRRWPAYLLAVVAVATPWLIYSTAVLTESAAYPAFLWAVYAMHRTLVAPSRRSDALAVVTLALAFFARTQFSLLFVVLPVALPLHHLTSEPGNAVERIRRAVRRTIPEHPVLVAAYAALAAAAGGYLLSGHHLSQLTVYGKEGQPSIFATATAGGIAGHAADLAFGLGLLPFLVGVAWLAANAFRPSASAPAHAFASIGATTLVVLITIVAAWDYIQGGFVRDRYLFYLVPLVVLAFLCALRDARRPRWSLLVPAAVVAAGFATHLQPSFLWATSSPLSFDSPIAPGYRLVMWLGHGRGAASAILVLATAAICALFVVADRLARPAALAAVLAVVVLVALPADTVFTFDRLLTHPGHSGRPLTQSEAGVLDWLDLAVGTGSSVTEVPYPVSSSFFVTQQFWRDLEFWNKSVRYDVHYPTPDVYDDAVAWFPNTPLTFDPQTGAASATWSPYVAQSINESRFRISGNELLTHGDVMLVRAELPWRTDWLTSGLYDDGWTQPHVPATIRVFPFRGQQGPHVLTLAIQIRAPSSVAHAGFTLRSNRTTIRGVAGGATSFLTLPVCVPAHGYSDATFSTPLVTGIPGDMRSEPTSTQARQGGLLLADLAVSKNLGPPC